MKNKLGFTLIEMLVVVLIIGILAGIALPQYQGAVRKARVAEAKIALRAIGDAADRWFLHNEEYPDSLEDLDIEVETATKDWNIYLDECAGKGCLIIATPKRESNYDIRYGSQTYESYEKGKFICMSDEGGETICKQLGGKEIEGYEGVFQI